jgi:hypothetical protein
MDDETTGTEKISDNSSKAETEKVKIKTETIEELWVMKQYIRKQLERKSRAELLFKIQMEKTGMEVQNFQKMLLEIDEKIRLFEAI